MTILGLLVPAPKYTLGPKTVKAPLTGFDYLAMIKRSAGALPKPPRGARICTLRFHHADSGGWPKRARPPSREAPPLVSQPSAG